MLRASLQSIKRQIRPILPHWLILIREHRRVHGELPNIMCPGTFSEMILHRNLFDRRGLLSEIADKAAVRSYVKARLGTQVLPRGTGYQWTAMSYQEKAVGSQIYYVFGLALLLVYFVLAGQYESWILPLSVILGVPLALLGTVGALTALGADASGVTESARVFVGGPVDPAAGFLVEKTVGID